MWVISSTLLCQWHHGQFYCSFQMSLSSAVCRSGTWAGQQLCLGWSILKSSLCMAPKEPFCTARDGRRSLPEPRVSDDVRKCQNSLTVTLENISLVLCNYNRNLRTVPKMVLHDIFPGMKLPWSIFSLRWRRFNWWHVISSSRSGSHCLTTRDMCAENYGEFPSRECIEALRRDLWYPVSVSSHTNKSFELVWSTTSKHW